MDNIRDLRDKGYTVTDQMWKTLIKGKPLSHADVLREKWKILYYLSIGIDIVRPDGRILGYKAQDDRFYDTHQYFGQGNFGLMDYFGKAVIQIAVGILIYGVLVAAGRYYLWKNNLPTMTPGMIDILPLPDRLEYFEKEAQIDSIRAATVRNQRGK